MTFGVTYVILYIMVNQRTGRYIQKMLHIPVAEAAMYVEIKATATRLKKSVWRYLSDLHKLYSKEESSGW